MTNSYYSSASTVYTATARELSAVAVSVQSMNTEDARRARIAAVEREIAEMEALDAAVAAGLSQRRVRAQASVVYSLRLDAGEVTALERRAASLGMKPTVLARSLLRRGLTEAMDTNVDDLW
jgi:hypothetical protein